MKGTRTITSVTSCRGATIVCLALFALMIGRVVSTYAVFSATTDEDDHLAAGVEIYQAGQYRVDLEHPPLSRYVIGLAPYLAGARMRPDKPLLEQGQFVLNHADNYWAHLTLARTGNLVFLPILVFYIYRWSAELYSRLAGVVAIGLATASPNVLAHAGLASVDLVITATLIAAAYHLYRWFRTPTVRNSGVAGCWIGVALMSKFSA